MDPRNPTPRARSASHRRLSQAAPTDHTTRAKRARHAPPPRGSAPASESRARLTPPTQHEPRDSSRDWIEPTTSTRRTTAAWSRLSGSAANARTSLTNWRDQARRPRETSATDTREHPRVRGGAASAYEQFRTRFEDWRAVAIPFSWRERRRSRGAVRRRVTPVVAILVCAAVALVVGLFALNIAGRAAGALAKSSTVTVATPGGAVIITQPNPITSSPTPVAPAYTLGVWVSNTMPSGGSVTVFVRLSQNMQPVANTPVNVTAVTPNGVVKLGPLTTNAYGEASTTLNYGNVGSQKPIFLTGTADVGGKTITAQYTFVTF